MGIADQPTDRFQQDKGSKSLSQVFWKSNGTRRFDWKKLPKGRQKRIYPDSIENYPAASCGVSARYCGSKLAFTIRKKFRHISAFPNFQQILPLF